MKGWQSQDLPLGHRSGEGHHGGICDAPFILIALGADAGNACFFVLRDVIERNIARTSRNISICLCVWLSESHQQRGGPVCNLH